MTTRPPSLVNARLAGVLYLVIIVTGVFSEAVRSSFTVAGDATATAARIADSPWLYRAAFASSLILILTEVVLTIILYHLFVPVSRFASGLAAAIRLVTLPIYASGLMFMFAALVAATGADYLRAADQRTADALVLFFLELHNDGYAIGLLFFALNCLVMAYLLVRSSQAPTALGILLGVAGAGYLVNSLVVLLAPGHPASLAILLLPALVAEGWLAGWLLTRRGALAEPAA